MQLDHKTAVITGGSKGIGKAIAQRFIKEGARVIVFDLEEPDYKVDFFSVDVRKEDHIKKAFAGIKVLHILINNAGIYSQATVEETSKEELKDIFETNFYGTYFMCKHAIPLLKRTKGTVVNIASALGIAPEPSSPAYCSSKAAIVMLTKCMAQEYATDGIRVNAVLPGPIDTPLLRCAFSSRNELGEYTKLNPMKRIGKPQEVASVALFLASQEASYVTGGLYSVDGGESTSSVYSKK